MTKTIQIGSRAVVINSNDAQGPFRANLYVNCTAEHLGDITPVRACRSSLKGIQKWADRELAR